MRYRIANPEADIPQRRNTLVDIVVGSPAVGVDQRQAVTVRSLSPWGRWKTSCQVSMKPSGQIKVSSRHVELFGFMPEIMLWHERRSSNLNIYDYTRNMAEIGVVRSF